MRVLEGGNGKKNTARRRRRRVKIGILVAGSFVLLILCAFLYILTVYRVKTVVVEGNVHRTDEEIQREVMKGRLGSNSLYLSMKYKNRQITGVPFVEAMDVEILSPSSIQITVYEKALAGCIAHLQGYAYFDNNGKVVEISAIRLDGIPQVTGLRFSNVILNEVLPVSDDTIFQQILNLTQMMDKYGIEADEIHFSSGAKVTLRFDRVRAALGNGDYLDEKFMKLKDILLMLEGESGVVKMENFSDPSADVTFVKDSGE